jgi:hypothetical protein
MKNCDFVILPPKYLKEILQSPQTVTGQSPISSNEAVASGMNLDLSIEDFITTFFLSPYIRLLSKKINLDF